ncbi:MAG: Rpn family recombination-promoting nuclease/putative transposase [Magnetococcales bacterium]|nr:Rpn family recombination-promoting nuclease/putative transposase [Magnetococcales bacterium]MBF0117172.1 Rpn family recombination-promoting nuclease/putative transposase [Magnetococcales bacterium]
MTDHDGTYHKLYSNPHMMADLVRQFVNEPWVGDLDFTHMEPVKTKFHVPGLPKRESDVIWRIPIKEGGDIYLLVLLEFQSDVDRWMVLRVVAYTCLLWLQLLTEKRIPAQGPLPPVVPVVLYNGASHWLMPIRLRDLIDLPDNSPLWKFQPDGTFFLIDESRYGKETLEARDSLSALVFQLEQCKNPEDLPDLLAKMVAWLERWPEFASLKPVLADLFKQAVSTLTGNRSILSETLGLLEVNAMLQTNIENWKRERRVEWTQEGEAKMLTRQLQHRFGDLPPWASQKIADADLATLEKWSLRILDAPTLESVLADLS